MERTFFRCGNYWVSINLLYRYDKGMEKVRAKSEEVRCRAVRDGLKLPPVSLTLNHLPQGGRQDGCRDLAVGIVCLCPLVAGL